MRHTKETKAKLSRMRRGSKNPFYGKTHTAKTKKRLAAASRIRNLSRTYEPSPQRIKIPRSRSTLAYIAGFLDADGSVRFKTDHSTKKKNKRPFVAIYNTNKALIRWFEKTLSSGSTSYANMGRERVLQITWAAARDVYAFLQAVHGFLIVKKGDAERAMRALERKYGWERQK